MSELLYQLTEAITKHSGMGVDEIEDAGRHGADAGWPGFTYTVDGAEFTRNNISLIWTLLVDEYEEFDYPNLPAYIASWNRADMADTRDGFDCLLSWWALEKAGHYLLDEGENE